MIDNETFSNLAYETQLEGNITKKLKETDIDEVSRDAEEIDYRKEPLDFGDEFTVTIDGVVANEDTLFSDGSDRQSQNVLDEISSEQVHDELFQLRDFCCILFQITFRCAHKLQ